MAALGTRGPVAFLLVTGAALGAAVFAGGRSAADPARPPTIAIAALAVDRTAHTVDLRARICLSAGPRAMIRIDERRTLHGRLTARHTWVPRALEPTRIDPFGCRSDWRLNWLLEPGLRGAGTYTATIRVRDAYGRWAPPVAFSVTSP